MTARSLGRELAAFAAETEYDDLPALAVHEAKRLILDSVGCALGALSTERAKMSVALARRLGGSPEASIIGTGTRVALSSAAFANGELINCLDYDALTPGAHVPPFVLPTALALAEGAGVSGRALILAIALALEIAARVARPVPPFLRFREPAGEGMIIAERHGHASSNLGAAVAAGRIMGFGPEKMLHAMGIAGHLCQVQPLIRFSFASPRPLVKYGMPGWQSTGAVIAALLADLGYTGDTTLLDGDQGFYKFIGVEANEPEKIAEGLGQVWLSTNVQYKPYPCCRMLHSALDCFCSIIDQNGIEPHDIETVTAYCNPTVAFPCFTNDEIDSIVDAQFNPKYVFAVAAHRIAVGPEWQDAATMNDRRIHEFMKRVTCQPHPGYWNPNSPKGLGAAEVLAKGQTFGEERDNPRGTPLPGLQLTDSELREKFRHNASRVLPAQKIDGAVEALMTLESLEKTSELMSYLTP